MQDPSKAYRVAVLGAIAGLGSLASALLLASRAALVGLLGLAFGVGEMQWYDSWGPRIFL